MGSYGVSTLPPASITCIILSSGDRQHLIACLCDINSLLQCLLTLGIHPSPPASGLFHSALVLLVSLLLLKARSCLRALALAVLSAWTFLFFRYQQALLLTPFRSWFKCYVLSDVYSDYTVKNCTRTRPSCPLLAENFFNPIALPIYFLFSAIHSITVSIYYVPGSMCTLYVRIKVPALVELTF